MATVMRPRETLSGREWLANFPETDVPAATLLLDGLRFVTLSALRDGLVSTLSGLLQAGSIEPPVLVLPERGLGDFVIGERAEAPEAAAVEQANQTEDAEQAE